MTGRTRVSSQRALGAGAGANLAGCQGATTGQGTANSGGGGGGGFKTAGGSGGPGNATPPPAGGTGGGALARPVGLVRGGCPGVRGSADGVGGAGGAGGGAIQLTAKTSIAIAATGRILSGGMGGGASGNRGGGGAGYIIIWAPPAPSSPAASRPPPPTTSPSPSAPPDHGMEIEKSAAVTTLPMPERLRAALEIISSEKPHGNVESASTAYPIPR